MKRNLRQELCQALLKAGKRWPPNMAVYQDEQAYKWFSCCHPTLYREVLHLPPELRIVK